MKKFIKYLLIIVGIIVVIGPAGFSFIEIRGIPSYEVKKVDYKNVFGRSFSSLAPRSDIS